MLYSLHERFLQTLYNLPFFETCLFIVLAIITLFRKELSSNRDYRNGRTTIKSRVMPTMPSVPTMSSMTPPDWNSISKMPNEFMQKWPGCAILTPTENSGEAKVLRGKPHSLEFNMDVMIMVVSYLTNNEISSFSGVSLNLHKFFASDFVWEQIWVQRYGELWQHPTIKNMLQYRQIEWDPMSNWGPPAQGWKLFLLEFEYGWLDWILAGCNSIHCCTLGLDGGVYDITPFVLEHPGSPETLLDHAGGDASEMFYEIGHSTLARRLKESYLMFKPPYIHNLQTSHLHAEKTLLKEKARGAYSGGAGGEVARSESAASELSDSDSSLSATACNYSIVGRFVSQLDAYMDKEKRAILTLAESSFRTVVVAEEFQVSSVPNEDLFDCHDLDDEHRNHSVLHGGLVMTHSHRLHEGQARTYFDPLLQEWCLWWTCCGKGRHVSRCKIDAELRKRRLI